MKIKKLKFRFRQTLAILLVLVIALFVFSRLTASPASANWYNDSWNYRIGLTFTNSGSADANKYITVTLTTNASPLNKLQSDCDDARFTDSNGRQLQYYQTNTCQAASTVYHVLMPNIPVGGNLIYFYYGNPTAAAGKNPSDFTVTEFTTGTVTQGSESIGPGPVAYWKFDEGTSTTLNDATGHSYSAAFSNSPTWTAENLCVSGKCLQFPGTNASLTVASTISTNTVSFWVKTATASAALITLNSGANIQASSNTITAPGFTSPTIYVNGVRGTTLTANEWQHVTVTTGTTISASAITIAKVSNNFLVGFIDDVKLYPYARTAAQILTDYNSRGASKGTNVNLGSSISNLGSQNKGLIGYWNMDDASATTTIADSSGNGNTGTLQQAQESNTTMTASTINTISDTANTQLNSSPDGIFNGMNLILSGASCNVIATQRQRGISGYTAATKTFTLSADFTAIPDTANCGYTIDHRSAGKFGKGIFYDGVDDDVDIPDNDAYSINTTGQLTVSFWLYPNVLTGVRRVVSKGNTNNFEWSVDTNGQALQAVLWQSTGTTNILASSTVSYSTGAWTHVTAVFDLNAQKIQLYGNGILVDSSGVIQNAASYANGAAPVHIGNRADSVGYVNGYIDDVRIYNRALTMSEVERLYQWAPGPIGWWKLDEGTSNKAYDSSGYGATGTLSSTTGAWVTGKYGGGINAVNSNRIQLTSSFNTKGLAAITTEAWLYPTFNLTAGNWDYAFASRASDDIYARIGLVTQYNYVCTANNTFAAYYRSAGQFSSVVCSTTQYQLNRWYHVAAVYNTLTHIHKLYVDGILVNTSTDSAPIMDSATDLEYSTIGSWTAGGNKMNGLIDDVRVYSYERTPAQIAEDMQTGKQNQTLIKYDFNENSGTTLNNTGLIGSTANATVSGTIWNMDGKVRSAQQFTGSTSYISTPKLALLAFNALTYNSLSWGGWFKPTNTAASKSLILKPTEFRLTTDASSRPNCAIYSGSWQTAAVGITALPLNTWSHVQCTYDGSNINVYVNGLQANGPVVQTGNITSSSSYALNLGWNYAGGEYFQGLMDDIKVTNFALTSDQVKTSANSGITTVMGALSTSSTGIATNSASAQFCPPGDASACSAPVAYWKFDENTGTSVADSSGHGYTGTLTNSPVWKIGKYGSALYFPDTNNQYVSLGNINIPVAAAAFTIEAWVNPDSLVTERSIYGAYAGANFLFSIGTDGRLNLCNENGGVCSDMAYSTTGAVTTNTWQHVVVTFGGSNNYIFYVNGKNVTSKGTGTATNTVTNREIGRVLSASDYFSGTIDDVKVYNYARTPTQVAWDYNRGAPVAQYKFEECQGNILHDYSGNNLYGTITPNTGRTVGTCNSGVSTQMWNGGTTGKYSASLYFDGSGDRVEVTHNTNLNITSSHTISAWVNWADLSEENRTVVNKGNSSFNPNYYVYWENSTGQNNIVCGFNNGGSNVDHKYHFTPTISTWYHIVCDFDDTSNTYKVFLNGQLVTNDTETGNPASNTSTMGIGYDPNYTNSWSGQLDDIRIYNYTLTPAQVKTIYNNGSAVSF